MSKELSGKHKGLLITGTDTGVGKTFVAAGLINVMKKRGINVCPMKPVESGCKVRKGELIPADAIMLLNSSGVNESIDMINPYRMKHPLAPAVAADIEGVKIYRKKIISSYNRLSGKYDMTIVEGAGGIMVPVYREYLFLDLAVDLALPVVIVARPGLGTINHTLLTIEAVRNKGLDVAGVIINYTERTKKGMSEKTNPEVIEELGRVSILGIVPYPMNHHSRTGQRIFNQIADKLLISEV